MDEVAERDNMCVVLFLVRAMAVQANGCAADVIALAGRAGTRFAVSMRSRGTSGASSEASDRCRRDEQKDDASEHVFCQMPLPAGNHSLG